MVTIVNFAYGRWKECVIDSSYFSVSKATVDDAKKITVMKTEVNSPEMSQRLYRILINGRSSTVSALGKLPQCLTSTEISVVTLNREVCCGALHMYTL